MLEYVVDVVPVFATIVDQVEPLFDDLSILYPVIADPPLFDGAVHDRLICDEEAAVAVRLVGVPGIVIEDPVSRYATSSAKYDGTLS